LKYLDAGSANLKDFLWRFCFLNLPLELVESVFVLGLAELEFVGLGINEDTLSELLKSESSTSVFRIADLMCKVAR